MMHAANHRNRWLVAGFSVVELLLVVTIIGIVAGLAVPALGRARGAAEEISTIGSLRAIHGAEVAYATACGGGDYAPSIPWLARPLKAGQPPFIGPEFSTNVIDRYRYRIRFTVGPRSPAAKRTCNGLGPGLAAASFFVGADLLVAKAGVVSRYFGVNQSGVIYESTKRVPPFYTGVPKAPAHPLR